MDKVSLLVILLLIFVVSQILLCDQEEKIVEVEVPNLDTTKSLEVNIPYYTEIYGIKKDEPREVDELVTLIVKAGSRPKLLDEMISSARYYYPFIDILVADDSTMPQPRTDVKYFVLPVDTGSAASRNLLLSQVRTKYFMYVDDDYIFTNQTRIDLLLDVIENTEVGLVAGQVMDENSWKRHPMVHVPPQSWAEAETRIEQFPDCVYCDFATNFFLAETDLILSKTPRWDPNLKTVEHQDFYIGAMLAGIKKASCVERCRVLHNPKRKEVGFTTEQFLHNRYDRKFDEYLSRKRHLVPDTVVYRELIYGSSLGCDLQSFWKVISSYPDSKIAFPSKRAVFTGNVTKDREFVASLYKRDAGNLKSTEKFTGQVSMSLFPFFKYIREFDPLCHFAVLQCPVSASVQRLTQMLQSEGERKQLPQNILELQPKRTKPPKDLSSLLEAKITEYYVEAERMMYENPRFFRVYKLHDDDSQKNVQVYQSIAEWLGLTPKKRRGPLHVN